MGRGENRDVVNTPSYVMCWRFTSRWWVTTLRRRNCRNACWICDMTPRGADVRNEAASARKKNSHSAVAAFHLQVYGKTYHPG